MRDAGELSKLVTLLTLEHPSERGWEWAMVAAAWGKAETLTTRTIFASIGLSALAVRLTIRKRRIAVFSAVILDGRHYVVTAVNDDDRAYTVLTLAAVTPTPCTRKSPTVAYNERNNPVPGAPVVYTFPGYITEKYTGHAQELPQAVVTKQRVLAVPKAITAAVGDVIIAGGTYHITAAHETDEYRNEYELLREEDV